MIAAATEIGKGCRPEGPHGPVPCGASLDVVKAAGGDWQDLPMDGSECTCGCSAHEDYCDAYLAWYDHINAKESE